MAAVNLDEDDDDDDDDAKDEFGNPARHTVAAPCRLYWLLFLSQQDASTFPLSIQTGMMTSSIIRHLRVRRLEEGVCQKQP